jgi:hypothetical protein
MVMNAVTISERRIVPGPDPVLRQKLLDYYVEMSTGAELSQWLRDLGQDPGGTVEEKRKRVLAHTEYLTMPAEKFPEQTRHYLDWYESQRLEEICEHLNLPTTGTKDERYRRIMREVGFREGWLNRPGDKLPITIETVRPFIEWYPILKRGKYEKDFYPAFAEEMEEIFGEENVHEQYAVAHGNSLKIDFHLGHPQEPGVGVEFKIPINNAELQRGIGQLSQYKTRYGEHLILVLLPDFINKAQQMMFNDACRQVGVTVLLK